MTKTLISICEATNNRVGVHFNMENSQQTIFLTQEEFLELTYQVFRYKDSHIEELEAVIKKQRQSK